MAATLTSKGQITVPKVIREHLHLRAGDKVEFHVRPDGVVEVVPVTTPLTNLRGLLPKPDKPLSLAEMDQAIHEGASDFDRD